jgi:hypothetical protein
VEIIYSLNVKLISRLLVKIVKGGKASESQLSAFSFLHAARGAEKLATTCITKKENSKFRLITSIIICIL